MPPPHHGARQRHDGKIAGDALERAVVAGPHDAVEQDIGLPVEGQERLLVLPRVYGEEIGAIEVVLGERPGQPRFKYVRHMGRPVGDEPELAIPHLAGDPGVDLVIFGKHLVQALRAQISDLAVLLFFHVGFLPKNSFELVAARNIGQANQRLQVMASAIWRLHQLGAEGIIDGRQAAGDRVPQSVALHRGKAHGPEDL